MPASTADRPSPGEADRHVAARLRQLRLELGLTLHQLAGLLGTSLQQVHKYETAANRLPADRLAAAAAALGVGVDQFFEGLGRGGAAGPTPGQRQSFELARAFGRLSGPRRETLSAMVRALAREPAVDRAA